MRVVSVLLALPLAAALSTQQLRERSIYQVITDRFARTDGLLDARCDPIEKVYCGGGWKGIERELDYIQGMGFDTVWISPIVANIPGIPGSESYHGYWASDIFQLNERFGTRQDLLDLSTALHARGMYLMVDVVANHVGVVSKNFRPDDSYGPFSSPEDFHPFCIPEWDNQTEVEQCWLSEHMADLNTESPSVVATLQTWIHHLVSSFSIDAIRIDTVKHVRPDFWPGFVKAAGVAAVGEVLHGDPMYLKKYQGQSIESILDFSTFFHLRRAFQSKDTSIDELIGMITRVQQLLPNPALLGSFVDNHDFPRLASEVNDETLVKNAAVFPFVNDGFPIVYQGQEHGLTGSSDPSNREAIWLHGYSESRHLYPTFLQLNIARRRAARFPPFLSVSLKSHKLDEDSVLLSKPPLASVLTNMGSAAGPRVYYVSSSHTSFAPKIPVIDVLTSQVFATDPLGGLAFSIISGEPRVFLPLSVWENRQEIWQSKPDRGKAHTSKLRTGLTGSAQHRRGSSFTSVLSWVRGSKTSGS